MARKSRITLLEETATGMSERIDSVETGEAKVMTDLSAEAQAAAAKAAALQRALDAESKAATDRAAVLQAKLDAATAAAQRYVRKAGTTDATGRTAIALDPALDVLNVVISCGVSPSGRAVLGNYALTKNAAGKATAVEIVFHEVDSAVPVKASVALLNIAIGTTISTVKAYKSAGAGVDYFVTVAGNP